MEQTGGEKGEAFGDRTQDVGNDVLLSIFPQKYIHMC